MHPDMLMEFQTIYTTTTVVNWNKPEFAPHFMFVHPDGGGDEKTPCWRANVSNRLCRIPVPGIMLQSADTPFAVCAPQRPFYPSSPRAVQFFNLRVFIKE